MTATFVSHRVFLVQKYVIRFLYVKITPWAYLEMAYHVKPSAEKID